MRTSPSIRRARRIAAACAALLAAASPSRAQLMHPAPDANPPATSALGVPCLADFSAPLAAANILGFLDTQPFGPHGYWNAGGVTGGPLQPLPGHEIAEHLSWFMATNSQRDSGCASTGANTWGRTDARTGGIAGTRPADLGPGFVEFARWDGGLYPFWGPPRRRRCRRARPATTGARRPCSPRTSLARSRISVMRTCGTSSISR